MQRRREPGDTAAGRPSRRLTRKLKISSRNSTAGSLLDGPDGSQAGRLPPAGEPANTGDGEADPPGEIGLGGRFKVEVLGKLHSSYLHHVEQRCKVVVSWRDVDGEMKRRHLGHMPRQSNPANHPNAISLWRKERRWTVQQLEEHSGISRATISRYENGVTGYSQPTLEALAAALNCTVPDLLEKNLSPTDIAIRDRTRRMSEEEKRQFLRMLQAFTESEVG